MAEQDAWRGKFVDVQEAFGGGENLSREII
jgi:hypothetical protein